MTRVKNIPHEFESEADFRAVIKKELEESGFQVKALSVKKKLPKQLANLADFEVRHPDWERGRIARIEAKLGHDWHWSSSEQEQLYYSGEILVFWWMEDVRNWIANNLRRN